jgi:ribosomal protein S2
MAERLKASDCKSETEMFRRFKSYSLQFYYKNILVFFMFDLKRKKYLISKLKRYSFYFSEDLKDKEKIKFSLLSLTMESLFFMNFHYGVNKNIFSRLNYLYVFGNRFNLLFWNLNYTLYNFKIALFFVTNLISNKGKILLVDNKYYSHSSLSKLIEHFFFQIQQYFHTEKWIGGFLSNFKYFYPSLFIGHTQNFKLYDKNFLGLYNMHRPPDLVCFLNLENNLTAFKEATHLGIPTVGLTNMSFPIFTLTFPIFANTVSLKSLKFFLNLLKNSIIFGYLKQIFSINLQKFRIILVKRAKQKFKGSFLLNYKLTNFKFKFINFFYKHFFFFEFLFLFTKKHEVLFEKFYEIFFYTKKDYCSILKNKSFFFLVEIFFKQIISEIKQPLNFYKFLDNFVFSLNNFFYFFFNNFSILFKNYSFSFNVVKKFFINYFLDLLKFIFFNLGFLKNSYKISGFPKAILNNVFINIFLFKFFKNIKNEMNILRISRFINKLNIFFKVLKKKRDKFSNLFTFNFFSKNNTFFFYFRKFILSKKKNKIKHFFRKLKKFKLYRFFSKIVFSKIKKKKLKHYKRYKNYKIFKKLRRRKLRRKKFFSFSLKIKKMMKEGRLKSLLLRKRYFFKLAKKESFGYQLLKSKNVSIKVKKFLISLKSFKFNEFMKKIPKRRYSLFYLVYFNSIFKIFYNSILKSSKLNFLTSFSNYLKKDFYFLYRFLFNPFMLSLIYYKHNKELEKEKSHFKRAQIFLLTKRKYKKSKNLVFFVNLFIYFKKL